MDEDKCFCVRSDGITESPGFALDIGSSQAKLVYVVNNKGQNKGTSIVKTKIFPRDDISNLVHFIKENCPSVGTESKTIDFKGTGFGVFTNKSILEKQLNARIQVLGEFDCFAQAVVKLLENCPIEDVFYSMNPKSDEEANDILKQWANTQFAHMILEENSDSSDHKPEDNTTSNSSDNEQKVNSETKATVTEDIQCKETNDSTNQTDKTDTSKESSEDLRKYKNNISDFPELEFDSHFPCLVAVIGSGVAMYMVTKDGKYQLLDGNMLGGRSLIGMAHFMIGTRDFDEIMELAKKGDQSGVDSMGIDLKKQYRQTGGKIDGDAKMYLSYPDHQILFFLGKATESDGPFKKEDIADSLVRCFVYQVTTMAHSVASQFGFKRVFFSGGLVQNEYSRQMLELSIITRVKMHSSQEGEKLLYGFFKKGETLGALGALLYKQQKS